MRVHSSPLARVRIRASLTHRGSSTGYPLLRLELVLNILPRCYGPFPCLGSGRGLKLV